MPVGPYDVAKAIQHARAATRRGDLDAAERWYRIAERATGIAQRLRAVARIEAEADPRPQRNPV